MTEYVTTKEPHNQEAAEDIIGRKFPVLDQGFVALLDWMGDDQAIVDAARTSYGAGTKQTSDTETLLRYLMRHRHTTPIEMCEVKLLVQVPMDCWRQWIRHRTATVNEYSTRYSEAINTKQCAPPGEWRAQSPSNKQGSQGLVEDWPEGYEGRPDGKVHFPDSGDPETGQPEAEPYTVIRAHEPGKPLAARMPTPGEYLSERELDLHVMAHTTYRERLYFGVAREVARKDLPLSTYTRAVWKIDLHNLLHFLGLRMDEHAQYEIRSYATTIGEEIVKTLFPITYQAFLDYHLNAMRLTALDQEVLVGVLSQGNRTPVPQSLLEDFYPAAWKGKKRCRERDECIAKLLYLGVVLGTGSAS